MKGNHTKEGGVLLRREISLEVICEKVKFCINKWPRIYIIQKYLKSSNWGQRGDKYGLTKLL